MSKAGLNIIELSEVLTDDMFIELPIITHNGAELTLIMGQSVSDYIDEYSIIISGKFLTKDGKGPGPGNIKFTKSGQSIKLMSIFSNIENIPGHNNNYYQILFNNYTSITIEDETQINYSNKWSYRFYYK